MCVDSSLGVYGGAVARCAGPCPEPEVFDLNTVTVECQHLLQAHGNMMKRSGPDDNYDAKAGRRVARWVGWTFLQVGSHSAYSDLFLSLAQVELRVRAAP